MKVDDGASKLSRKVSREITATGHFIHGLGCGSIGDSSMDIIERTMAASSISISSLVRKKI